MRKNKRAKACDISEKTKDIVYERDGGICVLCHQYGAMPNAHVISRAHGGLGIPENIVCLGTGFTCGCHDKYDNCKDREEKQEMYNKIVEYLKQHYPLWNKEDMIYRKYDW